MSLCIAAAVAGASRGGPPATRGGPPARAPAVACGGPNRHRRGDRRPAGSTMVLQATSPLLRSDFAQSTGGQTPNGDLTDSFVPATEEPPL